MRAETVSRCAGVVVGRWSYHLESLASRISRYTTTVFGVAPRSDTAGGSSLLNMESEVVEDVAEVRDGDDTTLFFVVEIEGFLEIEKEVTREIV